MTWQNVSRHASAEDARAATGVQNMSTIILASSIVIVDAPPDAVRHLRATYRLANPAFDDAQRRGRYTGNIPREYVACSGREDRLILPRGLEADVRALLPDAAIRYAVDIIPGKQPAPDATVTLRDYQRAAVDAAMAETCGYIVAPCGAGKTTIGLEVIRRRAQKTLVLVHTRDLLTQWQAEVDRQLGQWGRDWVTVATVQSLWGTASREAKPLPAHGLLIMDECHHAPSRCFAEVVGRSAARYRYGLTATPDREDGLGALIGWTFGRELYRVDRCDLIEGGHLVTPRLEMIRTNVKPDTRCNYRGDLDWTAIVGQLSEDPGRLDLVCDLAAGEADAGHVVLVLTTRVEHAQAIAAVCAERGQACHVVTGTMGAKARSAALADVREGRVRILVATQLADEGLDLPILDRLILALPSRAHGRTIQRIGRIMRPAPGKGQPVVYDLVDDHPACWGQWHKRRKAFAEACGALI